MAVQTQLEQKAFLLLLALVTVAFFWLLLPFYGAVFWAVILAIVFQPLQRTFEGWFGPHSNRAAALSVLVSIFIAIIPVTLILGALVREGTVLVEQVQSGEIDPSTVLGNVQKALPPGRRAGSTGSGSQLRGDAGPLRRIPPGGQPGHREPGTQHRPGHAPPLCQRRHHALPCCSSSSATAGRLGATSAPPCRYSDEYNADLLSRFAAVVRATVKGNIVIAVVQGTIGGVTSGSSASRGRCSGAR